MRLWLAPALALLTPFAALAQSAGAGQSPSAQPEAEPVATAQADSADTTGDQASPAPQTPAAAPAILVAGVSGGIVQRGTTQTSPFATLSLARYKGNTYGRIDLTGYRSVLRQFDTALPSHYYIASVGAGGSWNGWTLDGYLSIGTQQFGRIETPLGERDSTAGDNSGYFGTGLRAGHIFRRGTHWYAIPTLAVQYVSTRSLRYRLERSGSIDFQLPERSFTVSAAARAGYLFGRDRSGYVGVGVEHFVSDNGLTTWRYDLTATAPELVAVKQPDGWTQLSASGTVRIGKALWLDGEVRQGLGMLSGDTTTAMIGVRWRL